MFVRKNDHERYDVTRQPTKITWTQRHKAVIQLTSRYIAVVNQSQRDVNIKYILQHDASSLKSPHSLIPLHL